MSIFKQYLLMKPSLRMMIEWPILIGVGIVGTISSQFMIPFYPITNIFGIVILSIGFIIHGSSHKIHKRAHEQAEKIEKIVTSGIYSKIRHPGYLGLILIYWGFAVSWGMIWILIPVIIFSTLTCLTAIEEEKFLKKKFGKEYEEYMRRVPWRFIPKVF